MRRVNQAAVERLPLVLVVANNHYAYSTPNERQFACRSLLDKAAGYGVAGESVDGTDLEACLKVVGQVVSTGRGPAAARNWSLRRLLRLCGHGEHDDAAYVDPALKASPLGRDCLKVAESQLLQRQWADAPCLGGLAPGGRPDRRRERSPGSSASRAPTPIGKTGAPCPPSIWRRAAAWRAEHDDASSEERHESVSITYLDAIREAQARALAEDPRVFIYGQDVGAFGGAFKATKTSRSGFQGGCSTRPSAKMPCWAWP